MVLQLKSIKMCLTSVEIGENVTASQIKMAADNVLMAPVVESYKRRREKKISLYFLFHHHSR